MAKKKKVSAKSKQKAKSSKSTTARKRELISSRNKWLVFGILTGVIVCFYFIFS